MGNTTSNTPTHKFNVVEGDREELLPFESDFVKAMLANRWARGLKFTNDSTTLVVQDVVYGSKIPNKDYDYKLMSEDKTISIYLRNKQNNEPKHRSPRTFNLAAKQPEAKRSVSQEAKVEDVVKAEDKDKATDAASKDVSTDDVSDDSNAASNKSDEDNNETD